jgi:hypothetical protein
MTAAWLVRRGTLGAAFALVLGVALLAMPGNARAQRQSGIQLGYDDFTIMVSKDIGGDRWAISYDDFNGIVQGNVFPQDGGPPQFVWCEDTLEGDDENLIFDCYSAVPCTAGPCGIDGDAWSFIATVPLAASFLALPGDGVASVASMRPAPPPRRRRPAKP